MLFNGTPLLFFDLLEEKIGGLEIGLGLFSLDLTLYCVTLDKDGGAKQTPAIGRGTLTAFTQTTLRVGERYSALHALGCLSA
jgi:hypothetical protein